MQHHHYVAVKAETVTGQLDPSRTPPTDSRVYSRRPPEYTTPGFTILLTSELIVGAVAVLPPVTLVDGFKFSVNGWLGLPDAAWPTEKMLAVSANTKVLADGSRMHVQE